MIAGRRGSLHAGCAGRGSCHVTDLFIGRNGLNNWAPALPPSRAETKGAPFGALFMMCSAKLSACLPLYAGPSWMKAGKFNCRHGMND